MCSVSYRLGSNRIPIYSVLYVNMHSVKCNLE